MWFAIPSLLDTIDSFMNFTGLMLITASTFQIFEQFSVIYVLILSIAILRKRYNLTQYLSVLAVLGGLLIVTFTEIAETGEDENGNATENETDHVVLGIGLVVFG